MHTLVPTQQVRYVTNAHGKREEVIVPFKVWKEVLETLEALQQKQRIMLDLQQACREVKLQEDGELPEQSLEEFINEL